MKKEPEHKKTGVKKGKEKPDRKASARGGEKDDLRVPVIVIASVVVAMIIIIYISFKTNDNQKLEDQRTVCSQRLKACVAPVLAAYHREKGHYPENLQELRGFLNAPLPAPPASPEPSPDKNARDIMENFYCPDDKKKDDFSYIYQMPPAGSSGDFMVLKCRIHGDRVFLKCDELNRIEASQK